MSGNCRAAWLEQRRAPRISDRDTMTGFYRPFRDHPDRHFVLDWGGM
jgi:hypothetical protein